MTKAEKDLLDEKFGRVYDYLERIEEQTKKTNGRVNKLETDVKNLQINEKEHINKCPQAPKIKKLEENQMEYNFAKKYPVLFFGGIIVLLSGSAYYILKLIELLKGGI